MNPDQKPEEDETSPGPRVETQRSHTIKVEANLLRLPLFALHTRGLATLDGIEARGKTQREGVSREYVFSATRNTATLYPGPLARSAHMAILSVISDRGLPLQNPITWTWRDLCRRMDIAYSGRTVLQIKGAIQATQGLLIRSQFALFSKTDGTLIETHERTLSLYEDVSFATDAKGERGPAESNRLSLSRWYLDNLNAFHTAPLDYALWRRLDSRSTIASRLYEFLLLSFYGDVPVLRINYRNLAQLLPVRTERYTSDARKQVGPALELLLDEGVVERVVWSEGKDGTPQLHFSPGAVLHGRKADAGPVANVEPLPDGFVERAELRNQRPPEWTIVEEFYRTWTGSEPPRPSVKELQQARELVARHGVTRAKALVQLATRKMKVGWPQARTFSALAKYVTEAQSDLESEQRQAASNRQESARRSAEKAEQQSRDDESMALESRWGEAWEGLAPEARRDVERSILAASPYIAKSPRMLRQLCLERLACQEFANP